MRFHTWWTCCHFKRSLPKSAPYYSSSAFWMTSVCVLWAFCNFKYLHQSIKLVHAKLETRQLKESCTKRQVQSLKVSDKRKWSKSSISYKNKTELKNKNMFKCPFLVSSWLPGEASEKNNGNAQKKKPFKTCVACVTFYLDCYQNRCSSFCSAIPHFLPSILQPYLLGVKEFVLKYEFVENIFFFFFFVLSV